MPSPAAADIGFVPQIGDNFPSAPELTGPALLSLGADATLIIDLAGRIEDLDASLSGLTGYRRSELIGKEAISLIAPEWSDFVLRQRERKIEMGQEVTSFDCVLQHKSGTRVPVAITSTLLRDSEGKVMSTRAVIRDTRDTLGVQRRLQESEERFQNAFDGAAIGMAMVSPAGHWLKVNDALTRLLGYQRDELLDLTFQDVTHPDDLQRDLEAVADVLAGRISWYHMEKRYIRKDDEILWGLLAVSLVRGSDGNPAYFISQISDITAAKHAATERQEAEASLPEDAKKLSPREKQVIRLLAQGYLTSEAASSLQIADDTVQTLVKRAMKKLGARNRTHLVAKFIRLETGPDQPAPAK